MIELKLPSESYPLQNSDLLVVAVAAGSKAEHQFAITGPLMREYAEKCGADFISLHGDMCPHWPMGNKYRIYPLLRRYTQTLYLDVDVVVRPHAPSIFPLCRSYDFAAWDEFGEVRDNIPGDWVQQESDAFMASQGLLPVYRTTMFNGGVMAFHRSGSDIYRPPEKPFPDQWCHDQHLVTVRAMTRDVRFLDSQWNHAYISRRFWNKNDLLSAYFIHANAGPTTSLEYRLQLLQRFSDGVFDRVEPVGAAWIPRWEP